MHFNQANSARKELLQTVCTSDILVSPEPPVRYVWEGRCPRGVVTLLGAHGGTGKSLVALMLSVAAATGRPLFGVPTERTNVLFASFEDATPVLRRRLANICRAWRITSGARSRLTSGVLRCASALRGPAVPRQAAAVGPADFAPSLAMQARRFFLPCARKVYPSTGTSAQCVRLADPEDGWHLDPLPFILAAFGVLRLPRG